MNDSPTNWPNPERPGVPLFPERDGKHILYRIDNGEERTSCWDGAGKKYHNAPFWCRSPGDMARHYRYGNCVSVELTPAQISKMLAEEREHCAVTCENNGVIMASANQFIEIAINEILRITAEEIRNLGAVP